MKLSRTEADKVLKALALLHRRLRGPHQKLIQSLYAELAERYAKCGYDVNGIKRNNK